VVSLAPSAGAFTVPDPTNPVVGNSTYFDGLGSPYGGCGLPQATLDSQDFVALNVYNTPGDYTFYPRPIPAAQADKIGMWNNGLNCGRYVQVKIKDFCTGVNDGAPNQPFCRNGSWVTDAYNDGVLTMLVADSCGDSNAWCRDDPYHLDLAKGSLNKFVKNGTPLTDLFPDHFNNRHIEWSFVPAPNYTGDIKVGFLQGAQRWWAAIAVSHLANGIHGVDYFADGAWHAAAMNSDMGQSYIIGGTTSGATQFQIRVHDVTNTLINAGRVYNFSLPDSCASQCSPAYTPVSYTTGTTSPSPTPSVSPSVSPAVSPSTGGGCTVTPTVVGSWNGGFQADVAVRNNGTLPTSGWTVRFSFAGPQTIASSWNAVLTQTGQQVVAANAGYNGSIPANGSTSFGMVVNGANQPLTGITCTTR
jgi:hypothetical protein